METPHVSSTNCIQSETAKSYPNRNEFFYKMSYKLSSVLRGHELDVRAVCPSVFPEGGIITASRDRTARLWVPCQDKLGFEEGHVLSGHDNFISAVCTIPPTDKFKHGTLSLFNDIQSERNKLCEQIVWLLKEQY